MVDKFDGPIPGENYVSDTRNYPWHRPPEYTDIDPAVEFIARTLTEEEGSMAVISMLEMGFSVAMVTDMIITKCISAGKFSVDMALLLAGPTAHIIILMARGYGIEYDLGLEVRKDIPTSVFFKEASKIDKKQLKEAASDAKDQVETVKDVTKMSRGFMGGPFIEEETSEESPQDTVL